MVDAAEGDQAMTAPWPADRVKRMRLASLVPYARNARTHSDSQVDQLAKSIEHWGFTVPVLVDERHEVIAGHGRILAAERLGLETIPVMVAKGWTPKQIRAYRLADNQLTLNAAWDVKLLAAELGELTDMANIIGFSDDEAQRILGSRMGLTDPDDAPPLPTEPVTQLGDLWQCGAHRILCGDATKANDVQRLLGGVKPNLMVTDPPYGVEYDADWRNRADRANGKPYGARAIGLVPNDDRADWREAWALFAGDVAYVWHGSLHAAEVAAGMRAAKLLPRCEIVWVKPRAVISRGNYHRQYEPLFYAERDEMPVDEGPDGFSVDHDDLAYVVRAGKTANWHGGRKQTTVWFIEHIKSETGHSTQKPVECMRRPIVNNSSVGQAVYDPFVGSGTTLIAAEMEGRQAFCMDISPAYVDVTVRRWEAFTGHAAEKSAA
jgi:DNA modification methylase